MTHTKETARTTLFTSKGPKHVSDYSLFVSASLTDFRLMTFHHNGFWKVKPVFRLWLLFWIFVSFKNTLNTPWEVLFQHFSFSQKHTHPLIQYKISSYHISHGTNLNCAPCLDGREMLCLCVYTEWLGQEGGSFCGSSVCDEHMHRFHTSPKPLTFILLYRCFSVL